MALRRRSRALDEIILDRMVRNTQESAGTCKEETPMLDSARLGRLLLVVSSLWLWLAPAAGAVTFDWVAIGDPGNACDPQDFGRCFGGVGYTYRISKYEVTNAQYAEFLNAKAASDPLGLYNPNMGSTWGGITRSGSPGSYTYGVVPGRENKPVAQVSPFDAMRFVNWLYNGQGNGGTETGSYTLLGGTPIPDEGVERNPGATIFLTSDAEWYKAAYYDPVAGVYYDYPAGTDAQIVCSTPSGASNRANCGGAVGDYTDAGSYPGSPSPSGTFDQGGNAAEWTDTIADIMDQRSVRGGGAGTPADRLRGAIQEYDTPDFEGYGFRVASLEDGGGGAVCGDATCESPENALTCPADCPTTCGDGLCSGSENPVSCVADCPSTCGDNLCTAGENVSNCAPDCGFCGDDICDFTENASTCAPDCAPVCGDGVVEFPEKCEAGVPLGASCQSLGFSGGTLACNGSTCAFNTSGCTTCRPRFATCSNNSQCCSRNCRSGRCR
jgi:hypothetical protein